MLSLSFYLVLLLLLLVVRLFLEEEKRKIAIDGDFSATVCNFWSFKKVVDVVNLGDDDGTDRAIGGTILPRIGNVLGHYCTIFVKQVD